MALFLYTLYKYMLTFNNRFNNNINAPTTTEITNDITYYKTAFSYQNNKQSWANERPNCSGFYW